MSDKTLIIFTVILIMLLFIFSGILIYISQQPDEKDTNTTQDTTSQIEQQQIDTASHYKIVDTAQTVCSDNSSETICPDVEEPFYGQDAQHVGNQPDYTDNEDGTVTDNVTGLMWQKSQGEKTNYSEAIAGVESFVLAGYSDWRVPTIKELYSLINFSGTDPNPQATDTTPFIPFINTTYFDFEYGNPSVGDRIIDSQWVTSTVYEATVMNDQQCFFGVNFADGRIKCYPTQTGKRYFAMYVRGDSYGQNELVDGGNGTIYDKATGLLWQKNDSRKGMNWKDALGYCENLELGDITDWRLPNAKELQSIVDYSRSPDTTNSPAIDALFSATMIENESGENDYPFYWTSTTHIQFPDIYASAVYISFGRAMGYMEQFGGWVDVHGAGAQRSDPKTGNPDDFEFGMGPQGDARRIMNYARCVRDT